MQVTREQYEACLAEMRKLSRARTALGQQIAVGNSSPDPAVRKATHVIAKDLAAIRARMADVQLTIDAYKDAAKLRKRIVNEVSGDLPSDDQRVIAGRTLRVARQTIRELIAAQDRHPTENESLIIDALANMMDAGGFVQRAATEISSRDAQIADLSQQVARLNDRLSKLQAQATAASQRQSRAQQILAALWDDRYDEVDSFRTARGIKYRVHIDEATAQTIEEAL